MQQIEWAMQEIEILTKEIKELKERLAAANIDGGNNIGKYAVCHTGELFVSKTAGNYDNFDAAVTEAKRLALHCEEDFAVVTIHGATNFSRSADFDPNGGM